MILHSDRQQQNVLLVNNNIELFQLGTRTCSIFLRGFCSRWWPRFFTSEVMNIYIYKCIEFNHFILSIYCHRYSYLDCMTSTLIEQTALCASVGEQYNFGFHCKTNNFNLCWNYIIFVSSLLRNVYVIKNVVWRMQIC